ncbi:MAG: hypothetical protein JOZ31_15220 [Verrucomicrobia bacterium]|nr:hypothetical protein [Verrucomicrobiota bacterium]MBV8484335.1 hypothetical protein [Verrucomicrobiota bacterium]
MAILVLAPTLKTPSGHDHAFCTELIQYAGGSNVRILASEKFQPEPDLPALPFFSVDPYEYRWIQREAKRPLSWKTLLRSAVRDLEKIDFSPFDKVIFHTADPIYLAALSRSFPHYRGIFYLGFMLPPSFWLRKTVGRRVASVASDVAIGSLKRKTRVVIYSETGAIRFDHRSLNCLLKLPPVQSIESEKASIPVEQTRDGSDRLKIGFFGAPFDDKGFQILLKLADDQEIRSRFQIKVFLPPSHQELVDKINSSSDAIWANSEHRDLPTYFGCMASIDLVYTLYSPLAYKDRMSGIVQDALLAGKPLLVTSNCAEMRQFIDRIAPGSYVDADYSVTGAAHRLVSAVEDLSNFSKRARDGAEKIRRLKTFEAYFNLSDDDPS